MIFAFIFIVNPYSIAKSRQEKCVRPYAASIRFDSICGIGHITLFGVSIGVCNSISILFLNICKTFICAFYSISFSVQFYVIVNFYINFFRECNHPRSYLYCCLTMVWHWPPGTFVDVRCNVIVDFRSKSINLSLVDYSSKNLGIAQLFLTLTQG